MRNFLVALAGVLVALVGFAGSASALVSVDLIWLDTGTNSYLDPTGSIVLNVVLNTGSAPSSGGGGITVDYSAAGELTFFSAANSTDPLFNFGSPDGPPVDTGTQVRSLNAFGFPALPAFTSIVLATVTFTVTPGAPGGPFTLTTLYTGLDGIQNMPGPSGFGTASITRTPEPGTLSLLVMGLGGLYAVGRRQRR